MTQERATQSGAAASSAALAHALRGLSLLLCITLNNSITLPWAAAAQTGQRAEPQAVANSADALRALEALAVGSSSSAPTEQPRLAIQEPMQKAAQVETSSPRLSSDLSSPSIFKMFIA